MTQTVMCECGCAVSDCTHDPIEVSDSTGRSFLHGDREATYDDMNIIVGAVIEDFQSSEAEEVFEKITDGMTVRDFFNVV